MAPRKRSYGRDSDRWLGVFIHNSLVDIEREKKRDAATKKRLDDIRARLRAFNIDVSWAETAHGIMLDYGYGLNQFATRVVPELRQIIRKTAIEEERKAREAEGKREQDRREAELRRVARETQKSELAEARRLKQEGDERRSRLASTVKSSRSLAARSGFLPETQEPGEAILAARSDTISEARAELAEIEAAIANPSATITRIHGIANRSLFFDYRKRSLLRVMGFMALDLFLVFVLGLVVVACAEAFGFAKEDGGGLAATIVVCSPLFLIWHYRRLRRRRIYLSDYATKLRFEAAFRERVPVGRKPPKFRKTDLPTDILDKIRVLSTDLRAKEKARRP